MESIKLKKSNILKIGIKTDEGVDTGNYLEFDLEDIELPLRLQECEKRHKENVRQLNCQRIIISKKQDKKGKKLYSANEEAMIKATQDFYKKEMEALDLFLGEGGTSKLLNGRKPYISMYEDISDYLEPIMPLIHKNIKGIQERIMEKYKKVENDVIE